MKRLLAVLLALALAAPVALIAQEKQQKPRAEKTKKSKAKKAKATKKAATQKAKAKASKGSASAGQSAPVAPAPPARATDLGFEAERDEARIRRRLGQGQPAKPLNSGNVDDTGE